MNTFKYYASIFLLSMICLLIGGLVYSQHSIAKNPSQQEEKAAVVNTEILSYESADFKYKQIGTSETPPANFQTPNFDDSTTNGLTGQYFSGVNFNNLVLTRIDPTVNFDWGTNSPSPEVPGENFSVRWSGKVVSPFTGQVNFHTISDDGVRLWVNNIQIIDNWTDHGQTENIGSISLVQGQSYDIKMEYYENYTYAVAQLYWSWIGNSRQIIPSSNLNTLTTCTPVSANAVSWYRGEGNANDSLGTNNGTLENGATFAPGKVGQAFSFNGNSSVSVSNNAALNPQTFTIAGWVNPAALDNASDVDIIVNKEADNPSTQYEIGISKGTGSIPRGNFAFALGGIGGLPGEGSGWTNGGGSVPINTWTFVTLTFDGTNAKTYLNGVLARDLGNLSGSLMTSTGPFRIGDRTAPNSLQTGFNGLIDEIDFYNRALSNTEIQSIYNSGSSGKCILSCSPPPSGIAAWYKSEGNANDSFGTNNGILQNGTTFAPGKVGQAFSFDGVDDYVSIPNSNTLEISNSISIEAWIKLNQYSPEFSPIVAKWNDIGVNNRSYALSVYNQKLTLDISRNGGNGNGRAQLQSNTIIPLNELTHVVGVFDNLSGTLKVYINGVEQGSLTAQQPVIFVTDEPVFIGKGNMGGNQPDYFNGLIDEPTIYNRALSSAEIQSIYNASSAGKCQNGILASLTLNPISVNSGQTSTGTITLVNPAPSGGRVINLTSSDTNIATVPASITIPEGQISGTFTVSTTSVMSDTPVTITATYQDETRTATLNVLAPKPDLQSVIVNAPANSNTDAAFNLSWTDRNDGSGAASGTWTDKIYVSADNQIGNDTLLGDFPFTGIIAPNQSINRIQSISIPNSAIPTSGNYYLIVVTDANNDINEGTNENNNSSVRTINVTRTPLPDLTIDNITAPDTAFFGQTIRVQWTVKNIGDGPTNAAEWQDWYYISSDNVPEIEDPFKAPLQNVSYLAAGESYTASADITIPLGLVGSYKILVWTDSDGSNHYPDPMRVIEGVESNNYNVARPIQINAPPLPDLQTTLVQTQEEAFAGQTFNLNWRVENRGDGTTPPNLTAWNDKIYLSQNTTFEPNVDRLIGSRPHDGKLLATEGYSVNSFSVTLPNDIAGNWYVFVVTDGDNQIFEFGNENNNSNYDREQPGSPMRINATPPDLIIPNAIGAPNNGTAAGQITVSWTVQNQGAFDAAPNWFDTVYLSSDQTLNPVDDIALGTVARSNPLGAGLTYDAAANVALPSCISGTYYLFVYTDSRKQIFEYDPNFDAEANNYSQAKQITITSSPSDLIVTAVSNPVSGVAGQPTAISWTVANQGTGATLNTVWNDEVFLSPMANFVKANSTRIGAFTHTGALAVGGSYSQTQNIVIPNTVQGNYYVFVLTDSGDNVEECGAANGNDVGGSSTIFYVSNSLPDLTVSNFAFANSLFGGQGINVTWTVTNSGNAAAQNSSWEDSVYFSTDATLDGNDRKLADVIANGPLNVGESYTKSADLTLPIVSPGTYYLILKTDNGNFVFEGQGENNNTRNLVFPIDAPPVDLQVTAVDAPSNANSGQTMTVNWTVANNGTDQTIGSQWTDAVVLSLDQIDDPTDRVIGYAQHNGILNGGASYNATTNVFVPTGLAGQYYIFIRADRNNQLAESNENNNSSSPKPVTLQLAPPSDLIVTNVVQPATASPGESATFNWTVQNIGANPATGLWTDTVYLSSDQTWDIGDVLVGRYTAGVNVAQGQTYNGTLSTALPAVNLGNYYVIIRTDIRNRVIETNENNNSGASGGTTTVDVPVLQLGVPQSTTLVTGQERFYKFNAPANETVRVSLDGQDGSSNELYTRFGQMASRNAYDFLFDRLYEPDQQLLIPNTNAGTYYNMIRGENVPNSLANNEVKPAGKLNTKPIDSKQTTAAENVTVKAEIIPFSITSVSPNRIGDNGQVTITLKGARFENNSIVKLIQGNTILTAAKVWAVDSATMKARFFFNNSPHGIYDVNLINSTGLNTLSPQSIEIETATVLSANVFTNGNWSAIIGRQLSATNIIKNVSNVDIPYIRVLIEFKQNNLSPQSKFGITRPNITLPRQTDYQNSDWMNSSPTSSHTDDSILDQFLIRDLAPQEDMQFETRIKGYNAEPYKFRVYAKEYQKVELIEAIRDRTNSARNLLLPVSAQLPQPISQALITEETWQSFWNQVLIEKGYLDSDSSVLKNKSNPNLEVLKTWNVGEQGSVNVTCDEVCTAVNYVCELQQGNGFVSCLIRSGGFIPPLAIEAALKCGIDYFIFPTCDILDLACKTGCKLIPPSCFDFGYFTIGLSVGGADCKPVNSADPNEKLGPSGFGPLKQVGISKPFSYTINFENIQTATAAAQRVRVTDQLDPNVDSRTFRLKEIGFGNYRLQVPENRAFFGQRVQLGAEFNNILADISAGVDISTGKVTWTLTAIDPATGEQPNSANLGLLAPNDETGRGQGFVTYTVQPKQTAPTGTVIRNNATIIFDTEEPITTNTVTNTLDADIPTSAVNALPPTQANTTFTVSWAGQDAANGSGLQNYDIWVAEGDGAYQPFVSGTTDTSAAFTGTAGKTYKFYSIARDNAGNVEAAPAAPDAVTMIIASQTYEADVQSRPNGDGIIASNDVIQVTRFVNELDSPSISPNEFQRADSAPLASAGNGVIDSSDIIQTRRYLNELDTPQFAGGPSAPNGGRASAAASGKPALKNVTELSAPNAAPALRVENASGSAGNEVSVNVRVDATDNEAQYAFAVQIADPSVLSFAGFAAGSTNSQTFSCNAVAATPGRVKCTVGTFTEDQPGSNTDTIGEVVPGDNQILVKVKFLVAANAQSGTVTTLSMNTQSASDDQANGITPTVASGTVTITGATAAGANLSGRVLTANGRGISNARLTLTDQHGSARSAATNSFGYFRFTDVPAGETWVISVSHNRYHFETSSQVHSVTGDDNSIIFQGEQR